MSETKTTIQEVPSVSSEEIAEFNGAECRLSKATLYHGSAQSGINRLEFGHDEDSMPASLGEGLYFTADKESAAAYAKHRTHQGRGSEPTVYQVRTGNDLLLANLDNAVERDALYSSFQKYLLTLRPETMLQEIVVGTSIERLERLKSRLGAAALTHGITGGTSYLFSDFMKAQGYDGMIATEGGEHSAQSHVDAHRTVVIFSPDDVNIEAHS